MASAPSRPPLLFIHGMWSTPHVWAGLRAHFHALGHATLAPTLPFHDAAPGSPPDPRLGETSLTAYVDAVVAAASALAQPPIVVGHSMGGLLAQLVAVRIQPRALILLSPGGSASTMRPSFNALRAMFGVMTRPRWWREPTLPDAEAARWAFFNEVPRDVAQAEIDALVWDSGRALFQMAMPWADKSKASGVSYDRLTMPSLVVVGEEDRVTPVSIARATARELAQVEYRELPHVGHWIFHHPVVDEVAGIMERFVGRL